MINGNITFKLIRNYGILLSHIHIGIKVFSKVSTHPYYRHTTLLCCRQYTSCDHALCKEHCAHATCHRPYLPHTSMIQSPFYELSVTNLDLGL